MSWVILTTFVFFYAFCMLGVYSNTRLGKPEQVRLQALNHAMAHRNILLEQTAEVTIKNARMYEMFLNGDGLK
jgi:hypothetical protein